MLETILESIKIVCPRCRKQADHTIVPSTLFLDQVIKQEAEYVLEGFLRCSNKHCQRKYPILNGVPIILNELARWWGHAKNNFSTINSDFLEMRNYFSALSLEAEEIDAENSRTKQLLGTYMDAHYEHLGDKNKDDSERSASFMAVVSDLIETSQKTVETSIDLGCSVGGFTFALARKSQFSIGIDSNFFMVEKAAEMQRTGRVNYKRRKRGYTYETVEFNYDFPKNLVFLVADAMDPPFLSDSFDLVSALNLIDNVKWPLILLGQMDALLKEGGHLIHSSPYEWQSEFSEKQQWLESEEIDACQFVRQLLTGEKNPETGFKYKILSEYKELPWRLRHNDRYHSSYKVHFLNAKKLHS